MENKTVVSAARLEELAGIVERLKVRISTAQADDRSVAGVVGELERTVWSMIVAPVAPYKHRVEIIASAFAGKLGKKIEVKCSGFDIDLQQDVLDALNVAFLHCIRNAVDHGIESPEERAESGKPEHGTISVGLSVGDGSLLARIGDDGRGVDAGRVAAKAVEKKLVSAEIAARMTDAEKIELVFRPGFSTSSAAGMVSGRGFGLDSVRAFFKKLGGDATACASDGGFTIELVAPLGAVGFCAVPEKSGDSTKWRRARGGDDSARAEYKLFRRLGPAWEAEGYPPGALACIGESDRPELLA
ncbi:MAG: hypothetical protein A2583_03500 [Bdellovibrionales bacterium RIFOXYD1_FULL_53_11]|nr:MAG: hypothetical protein A2583_03500 [Bdellovibrionales bacterium RIFOXYD1_FULL_53_11]